jgi:dienelactone hydrolase
VLKRRRAWRIGITFIFIPLVILAVVGYRLCFPGITFLRTFQNPEVKETPFVVTYLTIPAGERLIPAKLYRPNSGFDKAVLLVHGVHYRGYEEARLTRLARDLARRGTLVLTPEIEDLKNFDIVPRAVDDIETAALFLLNNPGLNTARLAQRPGLFGISFAGGLGLIAASRPALNNRLGYVFSFGGHADLERVLNYLASGRLPDGGILPPHPYGQAVLLRQFADRFVPAEQVHDLRMALLLFLQDKTDDLKMLFPLLMTETRSLVKLFLEWKPEKISEVLRPVLKNISCNPALSPAKNPVPACPLFLLHGSVDNVIPASETLALGRWAEDSTPTRTLVSELIRHVELENQPKERPGLKDTYLLVRFMTELLRQ